MQVTELNRLYAALATPYTSNDEISEPCLRSLVKFVLRQGIDGMYVGGSTGESLMQTVEERKTAFSVVADEAKGKATLIGQVGAISTRDATSLARACAAMGYNAVSAIPPIYFPHSKESITDYYRSIVEAAAGLPLIIYNIPAMSGVSFSLADLDKLLSIAGIGGIKQTSVDMYQMEQLRRRYPEKVLLNGYDEMFLAGMVSGATGAVGSTFNIMGRRYLQIQQSLAEGNIKDAIRLQSGCNQVIDVLVKVGVFPGIKFLLHRMGVIDSPLCRSPFPPVSEDMTALLSQIADVELEHMP